MKSKSEFKNFIEELDESLYDQYPDLSPNLKKYLLSDLEDCLREGSLFETNIINGLKILNESISRDISSCFCTAPMQSGKTQSFLAAIIIGAFLYNGKIKCIFTSSLPRNKAFEQNKKIVNKANSILKKHWDIEEFVRPLKLDAIYKDLVNKGGSESKDTVQSFFNEQSDSCLKVLFVDECHYGSGDDSKLHECIKILYKIYTHSGINFIYNSATNYDPALMLSNILPSHEGALLPSSVLVNAEVAETYYGLRNLMEDSTLIETEAATAEPSFFYDELHRLVKHAKIQNCANKKGALVIVRIDPCLSPSKKRSNDQAEKIKEHIQNYDPKIKVIVMNSKSGNKKFQPIQDEIENCKIVLVVVTGYLSASDDLGIFLKNHVAGVLETFKSVQGVAQGLIGRTLGHNISPVHKKMIISKIKYMKVALSLQENPDAMRKGGASLAEIIQEHGISEDDLYDDKINISTNTSFRARSSFVEPCRLFVITQDSFQTYGMNGGKKNNDKFKKLLMQEALEFKGFQNPNRLSWTHPYIQDRIGGTAGLFLNNKFRSSSGNRSWPLHDKSLRFAPPSDVKNFDVSYYDNCIEQIKNLIDDPSTYPSVFESLKENIIKIDSSGNILEEEISNLDIQQAFENQRIICVDGVVSHDQIQVNARSIEKSLRSKSCLVQEFQKETESKQMMLELGVF
jgi:hypothetical protein